MAYVKVESGTAVPNILESAEGLVLKTADFPQSLGTADGDKKIVKAGTIFPANTASATGIVYESVDVTDGPAVGSIIVEGRVVAERITIADAAKTALQASGIKFVAANQTTR